MVALMGASAARRTSSSSGTSRGLTSYQVLIVASMVEREAKTDADRPLIAQVILNRLHSQNPFPLAIGATLYYQQDRTRRSACSRRSTLRTTPTCTPDLPPTPIANPGRASLERRAINPAPVPRRSSNPLCHGVARISRVRCLYYYVLADEDEEPRLRRDAARSTKANAPARRQAARSAGKVGAA